MANDQTEKAIKSYKKASELSPEENCHWCESSSQALRDLEEGE
ncbi:hypothetical protein E1176_02520 [Fulvivirga sp. RKSG066]|nr:hypothetical protein [Fulvivirga aurantia]